MLKAILSPLQVNAQGARLIKGSQNSLPEANSSNAVFSAMEVRKDNYVLRTYTFNKPGTRVVIINIWNLFSEHDYW
jgi:hypothetical protein